MSSSFRRPTCSPLCTYATNSSSGHIICSVYSLLPVLLSSACSVPGGKTMTSPTDTGMVWPSQYASPSPASTKNSSWPVVCTWRGVWWPGSNTSTPNDRLRPSSEGSNTKASWLVCLGNLNALNSSIALFISTHWLLLFRLDKGRATDALETPTAGASDVCARAVVGVGLLALLLVACAADEWLLCEGLMARCFSTRGRRPDSAAGAAAAPLTTPPAAEATATAPDSSPCTACAAPPALSFSADAAAASRRDGGGAAW
mmetsp:Transcript_30698/g.78447  ORF Transcript_30698/g.78447 Transcript_30698/m.78447 type:complete len:258 (-) Transcript_30698:882-1655(-)